MSPQPSTNSPHITLSELKRLLRIDASEAPTESSEASTESSEAPLEPNKSQLEAEARQSSEDNRVFTRVSGYAEAGPEAIVFAQEELAVAKALASAAGLVLAPMEAVAPLEAQAPPETQAPPKTQAPLEGQAPPAAPPHARLLRVTHPKHAFALCGRWLDGFRETTIHPAAVVEGASIGEGTSVSAGAVIEPGAVLGDRCIVGPNVTIYGCVTLGDDVLVQAGAVLGAMGFGYVRGLNGADDGTYVRFPQIGTLAIENAVEIGANTTIDRGALGETRIGRGTKIDNGVHIGHNCLIGKNVVIAAQVGISGSCVVGDGVVMAGQVGLGDHVTIGPGVILGGASGVFPGKTLEGPGQMFMGVPAEPLKQYLKSTARIRRLK